MALTRDQILNTQDRKTEMVDVSEWWGGEVMVGSLSAFDRDNFEASIVSQKGKDSAANMVNFRAKLVAKTALDPETMERLFSDKDVQLLGQKNAAPIDKIFGTAQKLSGIGRQDVEEMTKNSESDQGEDLPTD